MKLNNDPNKSNLIIVKSELNDKNSESYLKKIKSIYEEYSDEINLIEIKNRVKSQKEFEKVLKEYRGSVLCLHPHEFEFPKKVYDRDIENGQVVNVMRDIIHHIAKPQKILIVGKGNVGKDLYNAIDDTDKTVMHIGYRQLDFLDDDFLNQFDILVNCSRWDAKVHLHYKSLVLDCSGTFKSRDIINESQNENVVHTITPKPTVFTRGEIGRNVVHMLFQDVIDKGL